MKITALGYLGLASPRYLEWKTFGPEILGLAIAEDGQDGSIRMRMDERHHRITVHPAEQDDLAYIGWELRGRLEFEAALAHMASKGYPPTLATDDELENRSVAGMAWVVDPVGFRHEIYYGQHHDPAPFVPGRPIAGFEAGDLGLGHCVIVVPEYTRALQDFATEVLCLQTHWPLGKAEIYRCNFRSHCLVYLPVPGLRGLEHFYLDMKHMDDLGRAHDMCRERKLISKDLGRYAQDDDISFYIRTPAGTDVQYAYSGGRSREEVSWTNQAIKGGIPIIWGHQRLITEPGSMIRPVAR